MNKKRSATIAKLLLVVLTVGAIAYYVHWSDQKKEAQLRRDEITQNLYNQGQYENAAQAYQELLTWAHEDLKPHIRRDIAQCYIALAEDPSLPIARSADLLRQAQQHAPDALTDQHRRLIQAGQAFENRGQ